MKAVNLSLAVLVTLCLPVLPRRAEADTFGTGDNAFEIEFVRVGDPGNPADITGDPNPAGAVGYAYRIGRHEISREMIEKSNREAGLGIDMGTVAGDKPQQPASGISWLEAAMFVNWLNASSGRREAYKFVAGDFQLWEKDDVGYDESNLFRNRLAHYFLPSVDEWYKAAFYDPQIDRYFNYATGSDTTPRAVSAGTLADTAVYQQAGPAPITLAGGLSPYGTMAQTGNVWEWEETAFDLINDDVSEPRGSRGGNWLNSANSLAALSSSVRPDFGIPPTRNSPSIGFRVASVPEPGAWWLGASFVLCLGTKTRHARAKPPQ